MLTTHCVIEEVEPSYELEKYANGGFLRHSVETFGYDGDVKGVLSLPSKKRGKL